jgi:hypothetical protein
MDQLTSYNFGFSSLTLDILTLGVLLGYGSLQSFVPLVDGLLDVS